MTSKDTDFGDNFGVMDGSLLNVLNMTLDIVPGGIELRDDRVCDESSKGLMAVRDLTSAIMNGIKHILHALLAGEHLSFRERQSNCFCSFVELVCRVFLVRCNSFKILLQVYAAISLAGSTCFSVISPTFDLMLPTQETGRKNPRRIYSARLHSCINQLYCFSVVRVIFINSLFSDTSHAYASVARCITETVHVFLSETRDSLHVGLV